MANEIHLTSEFIYRRLVADTALLALCSHVDPDTHNVVPHIYHEFAGAKGFYPHVLILYLAGTDVNTVGASGRIFTKPLFLVEGVTADGNWLTAQAIADRIEAALLGANGLQGTLNVGPLFRERPLRRVEITPEGTRLNHIGGAWRTLVYGP